jgi:hypothetical protein
MAENEQRKQHNKETKRAAETLTEISEEWKSMERKTFEQRQMAEKFYETHLMKLITADFIKRNE